MIKENSKKIIIGEIILFVITIFITLILHNVLFNEYKNSIIENNKILIGTVLSINEDLEEELIDTYLNKPKDEIKEKGEEVLEKYGLNDVDNLKYVYDVNKLNINLIVYNILFGIIIFSLTSFFYIKYIQKENKKIEEINKYLIEILNGNYNINIKDYKEGSISNLKNDIYNITMILKKQKEKALLDKKNLEIVLSDISHQLKTPLTSMYVINDILRDENIDKNLKEEFLDKNKKQLERIEWLITSLLKISRLDSGTVKLKKEKCNIKEIIQKAVEPISISLELKNQKIELIGDDNVYAYLDFNWTVEAILNILKNAHEHSHEESTINVKYGENNLYTFIEITDNGEGIDSKDIKNIFKRFYKCTSNKESIGIGLNMSYTIIDKQNGTITAQSKKGKYTTFTIKFYKNII